jgi:hypothetical protein
VMSMGLINAAGTGAFETVGNYKGRWADDNANGVRIPMAAVFLASTKPSELTKWKSDSVVAKITVPTGTKTSASFGIAGVGLLKAAQGTWQDNNVKFVIPQPTGTSTPAQTCSVGAAPANGAKGDCTAKLPSGSTCQPKCNSGYQVSGKSSCKEGALTAATCAAKPCDASAAPANGAKGDCTAKLPSGSTCQPKCNSGYQVSGRSSCKEGALTAATCAAKPCDASAAPANGAKGDCTAKLASGSTCQPKCNAGFASSGKTVCNAGSLRPATCVAQISDVDCIGSWSGCSPACERGTKRTWAQVTTPAGKGQVCPTIGSDCADGNGACVMCTKITCSAGSVLVSSANTTIGGNETLCCAQLAVHEITLAGTIADLIAQYGSIEKFKISFSSAIAKQISTSEALVPSTDVIVTNVLGGSIKVQFYINSTSAASDKQLSQRLPAALANKTLQLPATTIGTMAPKPLTVSSFKEGKTKDPIVFAPAQSVAVQPVAPVQPITPDQPVKPTQSVASAVASNAPPGSQEDSSTETIVVVVVVVLVLAGGAAAFLKFKGGITTNTKSAGETDYEQTDNPIKTRGGKACEKDLHIWDV